MRVAEWLSGGHDGEHRSGRQLAIQVVETLFTRAFTLLLTLGTAVLVARALGPEGRGEYAVAAAIGMLGVQFSNLGLFSSSVYHLAREPEMLRVITGNSLATSLVMGGISAAALLLINNLSPFKILPDGLTAALTLLWIPIGLLQLLLQSILLGAQDIRGYNFTDIAIRIATALLTLAILIAGLASVELLVAASVAGLLTGAIIAVRRIWRRMRGWPSVSWNMFADHLRYGYRAYFATLFGYIVNRADLLVIQYLLGAERTGVYSVALTISEALYTLPVVIATLIFPRLSALQETAAQWRLTLRVLVVGGAVMSAVLILAWIFARPLIVFLFGMEFVDGAIVLRVLVVGVFLIGLETIAVQFLNARGFPHAVVVIWLGAAAFKVVTLLAFVGDGGIRAAAILSSTTSLLLLLAIGVLIGVHVRKDSLGRHTSACT